MSATNSNGSDDGNGSADGSGTPEEQMDTLRSYTDIFYNQLDEGMRTLNRPAAGQFVSSVSCGLDISLGPFMMIAMLTALSGTVADPITRVVMPILYTFGFIFVILGRSELFTEHTTLAVLPVLDGREPISNLARLWGIVYSGNIIGGTVAAVFVGWATVALDIVKPKYLVKTGMTFIDLSPEGVFAGAILAGWLMGLLSWMLTSVGDTISRIAVIVAVTYLIGFGHMPHCVAGNIEVIAAMMAGAPISVAQWGQFLALTSVGNAIGGVVFVSLVKYGHVTFGSEAPELDEEVRRGGPNIDSTADD
ncbi:formate/nitrite transporter family protein [Haloarcula nitratireducens]|uniref:Formate/nitrite transporter family protein n=1 Tax=Haloarcula nitratireducens TaxID=2487749 RepID=A0AAW4PAI6_9EURY|nr:formate/nitrite transporter family protein [Halomicroarcula nitratireducens]MBX0294909.1 formate/nitrite transporter family protein [Halomicroarcula nitratireducens]